MMESTDLETQCSGVWRRAVQNGWQARTQRAWGPENKTEGPRSQGQHFLFERASQINGHIDPSISIDLAHTCGGVHRDGKLSSLVPLV